MGRFPNTSRSLRRLRYNLRENNRLYHEWLRRGGALFVLPTMFCGFPLGAGFAFILLALLTGCAAPIHRNTGIAVGVVLGGETRNPCAPPRTIINNICTTEEEWNHE